MKFKKWIKKLEKRGIVSKEPHPILPFILTIIIILLSFITLNLETSKKLAHALFYLAGFSFIFSIIHWIVARNLE
jgi:hypothetical protein|tara:strand:+ start:59 stop:283 length:225 start_codon:yes stop_codon:yes gene_type:complete